MYVVVRSHILALAAILAGLPAISVPAQGTASELSDAVIPVSIEEDGLQQLTLELSKVQEDAAKSSESGFFQSTPMAGHACERVSVSLGSSYGLAHRTQLGASVPERAAVEVPIVASSRGVPTLYQWLSSSSLSGDAVTVRYSADSENSRVKVSESWNTASRWPRRT